MSEILLTKTTEATSPTPVEALEDTILEAELAEVTTPDEFFWAVEDTIKERYLSDERIKEIEKDGHAVLTGVRYFHGYFSDTPGSTDERGKLESVYAGAVAYGMTAIGAKAYELLAPQTDLDSKTIADKHLAHLLGRFVEDERAAHGSPMKNSGNERLERLKSERARIDPARPLLRRLKTMGRWVLTA